jgi:flagellum-specific peptidoglycan hydrolase FlgJ
VRPEHVQRFIDQVLPLAQSAAAQTGLPVSVVLAQWASESGWGRNEGARRNNLGCIMGREGMRTYPDLNAFVQDYVRVLWLGFYDEVRSLAAAGADADAVAAALGQSPYAEDHYRDGRHPPGWLLQRVIADFDLTSYDRLE